MSGTHIIPINKRTTHKTLHIPAADTAAVATIDAIAGYYHVIDSIFWSYSAAPTGGRLTITDDGNTVLDLDITEGGPAPLPILLSCDVNTEVVVTLAAGGMGVAGKLTVVHYSLRE